MIALKNTEQIPIVIQKSLLSLESMDFDGLQGLIKVDLSNLEIDSINSHVVSFYKLAKNAHLNRIQICIYGLNEVRKNIEDESGNGSISEGTYYFKRKLLDFLSVIQAESNPSSRKYKIHLY